MTTAIKTTVDQAQGIMSSSEELVSSYRGIPLASLKATTRSKLQKFWESITAGMVEFEPYVTSVDMLGTDFLLPNPKERNNLFFPGQTYHEETYTLGELADTREIESETSHLQFEIITTRVEKLLTDKDDGILNGAPLTQPIQVMQLPGSDQVIVVSGRHRLSMLLTLVQQVAGWQYFEVPVVKVAARTSGDVARFIRTANGSRSMTATEKSMVLGASQGVNLSVFRDPSELFADANKATTVTALKPYNRSIWVSMLSDTVVDAACSANGIGDIGHACLNGLIAHLKGMMKGSEKSLLLKNEAGVTYYQALMQDGIIPWVRDNWNSEIVNTFAEPKKVRGEIVTDENGEAILLFNPSRKATAIGKHVAEFWFGKIADSLAALWAKEEENIAAAKAEKVAAKKSSETETAIKRAQDLMQQMKSFGNLSAEVEQAMLKQIADLQEKLATEKSQAASAPVAAPQVDPNALF